MPHPGMDRKPLRSLSSNEGDKQIKLQHIQGMQYKNNNSFLGQSLGDRKLPEERHPKNF